MRVPGPGPGPGDSHAGGRALAYPGRRWGVIIERSGHDHRAIDRDEDAAPAGPLSLPPTRAAAVGAVVETANCRGLGRPGSSDRDCDHRRVAAAGQACH